MPSSPSSSVSSPGEGLTLSWDHFEAQIRANGAAVDSPEMFQANLAARQLIERRAGIPGLPPIRRAPEALQLNDDSESEPERPCNGPPMRVADADDASAESACGNEYQYCEQPSFERCCE